MKQALLVVSFGTSAESAREDISAVESALSTYAPGFDFYRAFTSATIRRILNERGESVSSLADALEDIAERGYETVLVQPTHLLYGVEYDKIKETAGAFSHRFSTIRLGKPLISDERDLQNLALCIIEHILPADGALVLMGHGTEGIANMVYPAMQTALHMAGAGNAYVGTVEGWPGIEHVLRQVQRDGHKKALLAPLMLVAGDHAINDMAGSGEESWKGRLEKAGISVRCHMCGLGRLAPVQDIYREHLREIMQNGF